MNKRKEVSRLSAGRTLTRTPDYSPADVEYEENFRTEINSPAPLRSDDDEDTDSYNDEYSPRERRQPLFPSIKVDSSQAHGQVKSSQMHRSLSANYTGGEERNDSRPASSNSLRVNSPMQPRRHGGKNANVYGQTTKHMSLSESSLTEAVRRSGDKKKISATLKPTKVVRPKLKESGVLPSDGPRVVDISPTSSRRDGTYARYDRQPSPDVNYSSDEGNNRKVPVKLVPINAPSRSRSVSPGRRRPTD